MHACMRACVCDDDDDDDDDKGLSFLIVIGREVMWVVNVV